MATPTPNSELAVRADERFDHILGSVRSTVTLIEYGDLECPTCKQAQPMLLALRARHAQDMCFVFRHFPLADVHPHARLAAEAAEAAGAQGNFWEYVDLLFERQSHMEAADLLRYAGDLGLDAARFQRDLDGHAYAGRVQEEIELGQGLRVRATPTFYLNGQLVDVSFGLPRLQQAVEKAMAG
jgi:protein-disulfide isomerase